MANWFPIGLMDGTRSWLMNLPEESTSSLDELRRQFVTNFHGTHDHALTINDLRCVKQRPRKTLRKHIQSFIQVCHKIPKASDEAIIFVFTNGVTNVEWARNSTSTIA